MYEVTIIESFGNGCMANTYQFETESQRQMFLLLTEEEEGTIVIVHNSKEQKLQEVV